MLEKEKKMNIVIKKIKTTYHSTPSSWERSQWKMNFNKLWSCHLQTHVNNIIEEVKNICRVLGFVETKQVSDAVKNLNLLQKRQPQVNIFNRYSIIKLACNNQLKTMKYFYFCKSYVCVHMCVCMCTYSISQLFMGTDSSIMLHQRVSIKLKKTFLIHWHLGNLWLPPNSSMWAHWYVRRCTAWCSAAVCMGRWWYRDVYGSHA